MTTSEYDELVRRGRDLYPGVRIGRPGRARTYWAMVSGLRVLRLRYRIRIEGQQHVAAGPAILVANHQSNLDPMVVVAKTWWRVTAFAKIELFEGPTAVFFRIMGQIPLRRGDDDSTHWAMEMARLTLAHGSKIGIYPEGTRSPDPTRLHRLHKRVLVPLLQANPDVPVHAITTSYNGRNVTIRVSEPVGVNPRTMSAQELTDAVRDALIVTGGLIYEDRYARDVKQEQTVKPPRSSSG